ncbi:outer membrane receptor protein involved in Fe transport [Novosphingobium hassiacum]|uniref:Outer membrane receptor protein involved in Fe transport n=1 Tax=Novosphingobium hassiacum TaxID=173676 RepID=A0A7W6EV27_9SPHN|nr:TonB-dependent receptor [Novosphingobium hassiacum]MBB3859520.1 outer membrane receptor protein involved in Fe transport [Novosphingobium hassiacum]
MLYTSNLNVSPRQARLLAVLLASTASCSLSEVGFAQEAEPLSDEIVVTATRQSETISKVALSVAAYSQEKLDQQGVRQVDDVARLTPGVTFSRGDQRNAGAANISIRGISSTAGSATTGIYIDETPIQIRSVGFSAYTPFPAVFDLQRVEILRGPQGTLFGAGSEGGTVRFITPTADFDELKVYSRSELAATKSGDTSFEAGAAVSVPLVKDKLAARLSGYYRRDGGYIDRVDYRTGVVADKNSNWQDTKVASAALAWKASDSLTITPSVYFQETWNNDAGTYWEVLSDAKKGRFNNGNAVANWNRDRFVLPALKIEAEFGDVSLVSNTSYFHRNQKAQNDYTVFESALWTRNAFFPAGMFAPAFQFNKQSNFTQEIRLQSNYSDSPLRWVIGGFYANNRQTAQQFVQDTFLPDLFEAVNRVPFVVAFGRGLVDGKYTFVLDKAVSTDEQLAGFGQVDYNLTEQLKLTAGVRVAYTKFDTNAQFSGPVVGPDVNDSGGQSETPVTPKFGISWQADDDNLLYASASKGFRIGGYNPAIGLPCGVSSAPVPGTALGALGLSDRPQQFGSDSVWSYEVGSKNKLFGRALTIESSAFLIDWSNIQQQVNLNACEFNFTQNLGKARSKGFDVQFQLKAAKGLTLGGSIGYTNAEFTQTVKGGPNAARNLVTEGDDIPLNPWQIVLNAQYDFAVGENDAYVRADLQHLSRQRAVTPGLNPANGVADLTIPAPVEVNNLNLRAGVRFNLVELAVFANNVTNETPLLLRQRDVGFSTLYRNATLRPRTIGLTATVRY